MLFHEMLTKSQKEGRSSFAYHMTPISRVWNDHRLIRTHSGPRCKKSKLHQFALTFAVLMAMRLVQPVVGHWNNASCPIQCHCQLQLSAIFNKTSLNTVNCSHQRLKSAPSNIPPDTEALVLSSNELGDLYDYIPRLWGLRELDLTENRIHSLGRDYIFHNLSELVYLNLAKNELSSLIRDVFKGLIQLQVLMLSDNKITYIDEAAFDGLSALITLNLGKNQLSSVVPEMFIGLPRLNELHLYENRIHLINSAAFRPLLRLQFLSLHGNRIRSIASDGFWSLDSLTMLLLERNNLDQIPHSALIQLPALETLYLSGNPLVTLKAGDFSSLRIVELKLNAMPYLKMIEGRAFYNLSRLSKLEISMCPKLAYIDAEAFVNVTVLKHINLQNNRLRSVPQQLFHVLHPGGGIDLKGNPFLCDCNLRWMRKEMDVESTRNRTFIEKNRLLCDEPSHAHGAQIQHLDLSSTMTSPCRPSIFKLMESEVERHLGKPLSLDCRAQGIPPPKLSWKLPNGQSLDNTGNRSSNHVRYQIRRSGTLYFYHLKEEDTGNYTCVAENDVGADETTVTVLVRQIDIQLFPIGISSTFVTLVWNGTERSSSNNFKILYRLISPNNTNTVSKTDAKTSSNCMENFKCVAASYVHRSYNIGSLEPDSNYEFCLSIEDTDGYYILVSCTKVRTRDVSYMLQGIHRMSNVAMAVVLGIVATMVMIICVVTVAAKKYRHRQYVCPDKHPIHRMSHIPMENLYCPLMSNASPY